MKSLDENLAAAWEVIKRVKSEITKGASNRRADRVKEGGGIDQVQKLLHDGTAHQLSTQKSINLFKGVQNKAAFFGNKIVESKAFTPPSLDPGLKAPLADATLDNEVDAMRKTYVWPKAPTMPDILNIMDVWNATLLNRCGNCHEQSCAAFYYLYCKIPGDVDCIDLMTFANKSYDHVWVVIGRVDASDVKSLASWGPTAVWCDPWQNDGTAFAIQDLVMGKVRNLDAIYKCNTAEKVAMGNPMSWCREGSLTAVSTTKLDASRFAAFSK